MRYNCATLRHAISRQKNLYFPLPQESMRTALHYPESPYGRTYADVKSKISRMDSLPYYLSYGAPLARASRAQGALLIIFFQLSVGVDFLAAQVPSNKLIYYTLNSTHYLSSHWLRAYS